ncbi:BRISC complex subunit FAM175B [Bombus impatiens]|uniref:BRISC complex subunit FAM175B n=1 Tax=Bombus impatiens TaxID=132113 RepID=A0A6P3UNK3_BOMIM|nr:BRISC complex subunit FAM175B [Bombus impatiens]
MADSDFLITISGPALSLLFYENVRSSGTQMGFLLGETLEFVRKTDTDLYNQVETVKIYSNIEAVVTCPLPDSLHNSIGKINKEKLRDFLRDKSKQVIGWFHFRRDIALIPTFRDKLLHKEFSSYFSNENGCKEEFFVTCLLSSSTSSEKGTYKFKHVFLRQKKWTFEPVPLRISNLGSNSFAHEGSDYKPTPTKKSSDMPDVFTKFIDSLNLDLTKTSAVESAITIQKAAEEHLSQLIPDLCKSDLEVAELERQVKEFMLIKKTKVNGNSNNVTDSYESEKDEFTDARQKSGKTSPSRIEPLDDTCQESRTIKDHSTAPNKTMTAHKPKNSTTCTEQNVDQDKSKRSTTSIMNSPSQDPPPINSVSEIKVNVTENVSSKNRRFSNVESEIVKESICRGETNVSGFGRGRGKLLQDYIGLKKARRTSGPESSEANSVQNTSLQMSYNQITKKKVDSVRKSDTTNNH